MTSHDVLMMLIDTLRESVSDLRIQVRDLKTDGLPAERPAARCTSVAQVVSAERERDGNIVCFPGTPLGHVLTMQGKKRPRHRRRPADKPN
jgi:hypothetical protein